MTNEDRIRIAEAEGLLTDWRSMNRNPAYDTIDSIQHAVLAQDEQFYRSFNDLVSGIIIIRNCYWFQLTAADWGACFLAVLNEREKK